MSQWIVRATGLSPLIYWTHYPTDLTLSGWNRLSFDPDMALCIDTHNDMFDFKQLPQNWTAS